MTDAPKTCPKCHRLPDLCGCTKTLDVTNYGPDRVRMSDAAKELTHEQLQEVAACRDLFIGGPMRDGEPSQEEARLLTRPERNIPMTEPLQEAIEAAGKEINRCYIAGIDGIPAGVCRIISRHVSPVFEELEKERDESRDQYHRLRDAINGSVLERMAAIEKELKAIKAAGCSVCKARGNWLD